MRIVLKHGRVLSLGHVDKFACQGSPLPRGNSSQVGQFLASLGDFYSFLLEEWDEVRNLKGVSRGRGHMCTYG